MDVNLLRHGYGQDMTPISLTMLVNRSALEGLKECHKGFDFYVWDTVTSGLLYCTDCYMEDPTEDRRAALQSMSFQYMSYALTTADRIMMVFCQEMRWLYQRGGYKVRPLRDVVDYWNKTGDYYYTMGLLAVNKVKFTAESEFYDSVITRVTALVNKSPAFRSGSWTKIALAIESGGV